MSDPYLCQPCGWYHLFCSMQEIILELSLSEQARKHVHARTSHRNTVVLVNVHPLQQLSRLSSHAGRFDGKAGEDECPAPTGHGCAWNTDQSWGWIDTHATTRSWPADKPKGMEGQHTGSFTRVWSKRSANSRAPGPSPRLGRCPRFAWWMVLLSQAVAGALSSRRAVFLPRPLLSLSLLCSSGSFTALKVEAGRPGGARSPVFSGGAPAFKAAAAFPRPMQMLRARF